MKNCQEILLPNITSLGLTLNVRHLWGINKGRPALLPDLGRDFAVCNPTLLMSIGRGCGNDLRVSSRIALQQIGQWICHPNSVKSVLLSTLSSLINQRPCSFFMLHACSTKLSMPPSVSNKCSLLSWHRCLASSSEQPTQSKDESIWQWTESGFWSEGAVWTAGYHGGAQETQRNDR